LSNGLYEALLARDSIEHGRSFGLSRSVNVQITLGRDYYALMAEALRNDL
jgi:hypothetical protein